ncbi:hypothetical protein [Hydrogenophaga sp.]|uniref:hypothetical protein n=1 Tax=Hydrogenophaga sp. TaxID=1904254 RepID=UPI003F70BB9D
MTVVVQTPFNQHTANGVTTLFGFTFQLLAEGDLQVSLDEVVQGSGYTISGLGVQAGGSITFSVAPANGVIVDIRRAIPLARSTDYQQNGDLPSDQIDEDYDRLWQALQDAKFNAGLTVQVPLGDAAAPVTIPVVADRAGKFLAFDGSGNAIAADTLTAGVAVSTFMETVLDDANAADARTTLGLGEADAIASLGLGQVASEDVVPFAKGGTGQITALAAFDALKQAASDAYAGTQENATDAETQAGTATDRTVTPASFAAASLGYGQTWQAVTRTAGVTYTNSTGRPIMLVMNINASGSASCSVNININGGGAITFLSASAGTGPTGAAGSFIIPPGATYVLGEVNVTSRNVYELR